MLQLLEETGHLGSKPLHIPIDPKVRLNGTNGSLLDDPISYRRLVGKLIYLTISRPNISFIVHQLSQFLTTPTIVHLAAAHHLLRYLKGDPGQGVFFSSQSSLHLKAFF